MGCCGSSEDKRRGSRRTSAYPPAAGYTKRIKALEKEQAEIDAIEDDEKRLEKQRGRYRCRDKFITPDRIEPWAATIVELQKIEGNTRAKESDAPKPMWGGSANDKITITETDRARRFEVNDALNNKVAVYKGDITTLEIDAIVNAAKESLLGGGGIDGAIHRAAGELLVEECRPLGGCPTGGAKITRGYNLPAKHVIHTPGPVGSGNKELKSCYMSTLELVKKHQLRTVAICTISTGIFAFPLVKATHIALSTVREWLEDPENAASVDKIIFCIFEESHVKSYELLMPSYFPVAEYPAESTEEPGFDINEPKDRRGLW